MVAFVALPIQYYHGLSVASFPSSGPGRVCAGHRAGLVDLAQGPFSLLRDLPIPWEGGVPLQS